MLRSLLPNQVLTYLYQTSNGWQKITTRSQRLPYNGTPSRALPSSFHLNQGINKLFLDLPKAWKAVSPSS